MPRALFPPGYEWVLNRDCPRGQIAAKWLGLETWALHNTTLVLEIYSEAEDMRSYVGQPEDLQYS
jgi:hypothetical protein